LALALCVVSGQANAELLKNFKFNGSVEMDATSARNVQEFDTSQVDRIGAAQTRVMLGLGWDLLDDVHSKVSLYKNDQVYGQTAGNAGPNGEQSLNDIQSAVLVSQAYFKIDKVFGYVDSTFGRQYYGDPGDLIAYYGPKYDQYGMNVTSIDGAKFAWAGETVYAAGLAFRPLNPVSPAVNTIGNSGGGLNGQQDILALMAGNKDNGNVDGKVSLWNQKTHITQGAASGANDNLYIAEVKVKGKAAGAYASVEVGYDFGENRNSGNDSRYDGKAVLADLGYQAEVEQIGAAHPWAQLGWGSGNGTTSPGSHNEDFQSIATDYRPGAIYGRFDHTAALKFAGDGSGNISSNGLCNRKLWGVGVKATPKALQKLTVGGAYWDFNLDKLVDNTLLLSSGPNAAGNRHIGSEIDVTGEWKHSENVSFLGTIGDFHPGGLLKNIGGDDPAFMASLDVTVKF
jgi:hypothetical protein